MKSNQNKDFTVSITVKKTPAEVYRAINDVAAWWVGKVEGQALKAGDTFTYRYKDLHESKQRVVELSPNKKVVWRVDDANLSFAKNKKEWKGTDIVFEIIPDGDNSTIKFTHVGLTPAFECFDACSGGWEFYITKSLKNFLTNGKGIDPGF